MNISTDHQDEKPFQNKPSGSYEWWYFDALSDDGLWAFVVIFYQGNPFSPEYIQNIDKNNAKPDDFPAVSISLYNRNKTEFYSFVEYSFDDFEWKPDLDICSIGEHSFSKEVEGKNVLYSVKLNEELPSGHSIVGDIKFKSPLTSSVLIEEKNSEEHHFWNLIQPASKIKASLHVKGKSGEHKLNFTGAGYHDHNVGLEPMKNDFEDWYWGRYHFKDVTLVYYIMNRANEKQHKAWLIDKMNSQILDEFKEIETKGFLRNLFGILCARKIILQSSDSEITIQTPLSIDSGPFYQRFLGRAVMNKGDKIEIAEGFSEYIFPKNIYSKKFWPAVKMRIRFKHKKPHWVQKFKMFYEWTW